MTKIPIPLTLKVRYNGFDYVQLLRSGFAYIYRQTVNGFYYYEVFKHKIAPEKNIKSKIIPSRIRFPNDEAFGYWAWSYNSLDRAIIKFFELHGIKLNQKSK